MRQIKINSGSWQKDLEMVVTVIDEDKFKNHVNKLINSILVMNIELIYTVAMRKQVLQCSVLSASSK